MTPKMRRVVAVVWLGTASIVTLILLSAAVLAALGVVKLPTVRRVEQKIDLSGEARRYICGEINTRAIAPLRGLLEQARTAATRNPLPPGLSDDLRAYYEAQRKQADDFYRQWLDDTEPIDCAKVGVAGP